MEIPQGLKIHVRQGWEPQIMGMHSQCLRDRFHQIVVKIVYNMVVQVDNKLTKSNYLKLVLNHWYYFSIIQTILAPYVCTYFKTFTAWSSQHPRTAGAWRASVVEVM